MIRPESRLVTLPAFALGIGAGLLAYLYGASGLAAAQGFGDLFDGRISVALFWGMVVATAASGLQALLAARAGRAPDPAATRMIEALTDGSRSVLGIAATCACAGLIVSVVNLTGLGLTISVADRGARRRRAAARDRARGDRHVDSRHRRAGDGELHHRRRDAGAGLDQGRRARARRAHVHVLLRGARRRVAADRARPLRRLRHHGRKTLSHHGPGLEVHAARLPGAVHVLPDAGGPAAPDGHAGGAVARDASPTGPASSSPPAPRAWRSRASASARPATRCVPPTRWNGCWRRSAAWRCSRPTFAPT